MGVPKFFRYISERYPCLSELIREYQIPEFDNMYLDMNGIIHMCSHPDDNNPHFRITEEKIFQDIFHYLEVLFRMIKPRKLFFMAVDGVAPRAKMNQQRGRRFRSAKDAEKQEEEAKKKGETLPTEARFDSNCITPGTVFMARLHEQLKYFCTDKISNDPLWRNVKIILSGHETPGEGEHKIMDYIRYIRAQPGYDPNTRHCLYGLDADLIMLGLCTHEPHFSLLREEVKFGKKSTKRQSVPEEITFYLLHLSLMREYLELEFFPLKEKLIGFEYDFEKIIDDWVLMGFLVGNDFIPNLPHLHIANGALPILYKAYMEVLPTLNGYINESGTLNLERFEKFMQKLSEFDVENFEEIRDDINYMESKTGRKFNHHSKVSSVRELQEWVADEDLNKIKFECLEREDIAKSYRDSGLEALINATDELDVESDEEDEENEYDDKAFREHKREYYINKLEYVKVTPEVLRDQAEGYVRAIQWNLNYYYNGVCSWSWYYPHHYAPYISDIKGFSDLKLDFELGTPFKPYEQLLAVLPAASKNLLPEPYHHLMTSDESPISKYYPEEFQTDLNGKRQEWEAVVLIPFMDEKLLLEAMRPCNEKLSPEEERRNSHGPMLVYSYSDEDFGMYESSSCFPPVKHNHAKVEPIFAGNLRVPREKLVKGAYPGVCMDVYYPGFPTLKHLKYTAELRKAKVKVFEQPSRNESMIIKITQEERDPEDIPVELLGQYVFISWPHLIEGRVVAISNRKTKYVSMGDSNQYNTEEIADKTWFTCECSSVVERYENRLGIEVGDVDILCHVQVMIGRRYIFSPNGRLTLEKQFSEMTANYPLQTIVTNIEAHDSHRTIFRNIQDVFPEGEICFTLGNPYYGSQGIVVDNKDAQRTGRIKVCVSVTDEPNFDKVRVMKDEMARNYKTLFNAASQLGMSHFLYSRITGTIFLDVPNGEGGFKSSNIGLDLKFNKKNKETPGYTRKIGTTWYYTNKCTELVKEYSEKFPEVFVFFADQSGYDNVKVESLFGNDWEDKFKELQLWLRSVPTYSLERQPCGSQVTEPEIVEEIERIVDSFPMAFSSKKVTMTIKPMFLYKPEIQSGTLAPDPKMQVQMFDRIVNTRKGFSVPFGLKGTVIAIVESSTKCDRDTMYDIVFDKPFKDGMQLNCSPGRGYRLPQTAFIDISYGRRVLEHKTGKGGSLVAMAESNRKAETPWHNTNGQKFFNQFMTSAKTHIPDQYPVYHQKSREPVQEPSYTEHIPGSAFAPFNNKPRSVNPCAVPQEIPEKNGIANSVKPTLNIMETPHSEDSSGANESRDLFMPSLSQSIQKERTSERHHEKDVLKEIPAEIKRKEPSERPAVNTDFLKNLLKIGGSVPTKKTAKTDAREKKSELSPKNNDEPIEKRDTNSSNVSFEMLAQQFANTPASIRLLTYYQSNDLGVPRYQYFETDSNMYKAQITLTSGELIVGEPAETKEQATEKVASDVLQLLMKTKSAASVGDITLSANKTLPIPPKTWVEPPKEKSVDRDSDVALKTALHNPFVPTQVIKKAKTPGSQKPSDQGKSSYQAESTFTTSRPEKQNKSNEVTQPASSTQQRGPKKSRIAANFGAKK